MLDIDFFKLYNDNYGHQGGDECLKNVANLLSSVIQRETDFLARYGGEEFSVILPDTDLKNSVKIAEDMRLALGALRIEHAKSKISNFVSISLGVAAVVPKKDTEPELLITAADQALYRAKADGRDRVKSDLN
jgi:diguanylate cyclase (GGDEF)-like protein